MLNVRRFAALICCALALWSCRPPAASTQAAAAGANLPFPATGAPYVLAALSGQVDFGDRQVLATMLDVASAATVSLIDTGTNRTVSTTLTDAG